MFGFGMQMIPGAAGFHFKLSQQPRGDEISPLWRFLLPAGVKQPGFLQGCQGWPKGCTEMPKGAGDHLHSAADTGSELLEASWDAPESELKMDTDTATACSRFPSNPKLKRSGFFPFPRRIFLHGIRGE